MMAASGDGTEQVNDDHEEDYSVPDNIQLK